MIAVIFEVVPREGHADAYFKLAASLREQRTFVELVEGTFDRAALPVAA